MGRAVRMRGGGGLPQSLAYSVTRGRGGYVLLLVRIRRLVGRIVINRKGKAIASTPERASAPADETLQTRRVTAQDQQDVEEALKELCKKTLVGCSIFGTTTSHETCS